MQFVFLKRQRSVTGTGYKISVQEMQFFFGTKYMQLTRNKKKQGLEIF